MRSKQKRTYKKNDSSRTKIVCTLGPKTEKKEILLQMIEAGMDVARLNFSHNSHQWHKMMFERVRTIDPEMTIFFDLQGPKIRLGELATEPIHLERGEQIILTSEDIVGNKERVSVSLESLPKSVKKGNLIYINDGLVGLKVLKIDKNDVHCKIMSSGEIRSRKGVNIPNVELNIPILTAKDYEDLEFALELEPDYIALSFVRKAEDILNLRKKIAEADKNIPIISKIEHAFAVTNFDKILAASDAIMVARGDLGIETSVEKLPILQKNIIQKCNLVGKPVITATQMLESMVTNPRPSRAEASDVANAIYDGTDAVMLSAETAIGNYPIESIKMMNKIASYVEKELEWREFPIKNRLKEDMIPENLAMAAGMLVEKMNVKAIIAFTEGGFSARLIAKHRPRTKIFVATHNIKIIRRLGLVWGSYPIRLTNYSNIDQMVVEVVALAKDMGYLKLKDIIVVVSGSVLCPGKTNLIRAYKVADIPSPQEFEAIK